MTEEEAKIGKLPTFVHSLNCIIDPGEEATEVAAEERQEDREEDTEAEDTTKGAGSERTMIIMESSSIRNPKENMQMTTL